MLMVIFKVGNGENTKRLNKLNPHGWSNQYSIIEFFSSCPEVKHSHTGLHKMKIHILST